MRCQGFTSTGRQCRNFIKMGEKYCSIKHSTSKPKHVEQIMDISPSAAKRNANLVPGASLMPQDLKDKLKTVFDGYGSDNLLELAKVFGPLIFNNLCDLATNGQSEETRLKASAFIIERIYGKAVQPLLVQGKVDINVGVIMINAKTEPENIIEIDAVTVDDE